MVNYKRYLKGFVFAFTILFLLGFVYPTVTAEVTHFALPYKSAGSPVEINGTVYGSYLLADAFNASYFFQARPSTANMYPIDTNATLNQTEQYLQQFQSENPTVNISQVPYAMVAYSASGQDPNIPILGATDQVARIATSIHDLGENHSVNISVTDLETQLNSLIYNNQQRNFPIFGSYYVNTVTLNVWVLNYLISNNILPSNVLN